MHISSALLEDYAVRCTTWLHFASYFTPIHVLSVFDPRRGLPFVDALWAITDLPTKVPKLTYPSCHTIGPTDLVRGPFSTALVIETAVSGHCHKHRSFLPYVLREERICPHGRPSPACQSYLRAIIKVHVDGILLRVSGSV